MFKNICVFVAGAAVGATIYHFATKTVEAVVEVVVDTVVS